MRLPMVNWPEGLMLHRLTLGITEERERHKKLLSELSLVMLLLITPMSDSYRRRME